MNYSLFAASIDRSIPMIDLHQFPDVRSAIEYLEIEAFILVQSSHLCCRVVYGIGSGVMRTETIIAIEQNPMFGEYMEEDTGGSLVVLL
jgi:hypothetical protein